MDEKRLAEIEARANAATPGPWIGDGEFGFVFQRGASRAHCIARLDHEDVRDTSGADLAFLAHARTDVPDLVAALATATAERDEHCRPVQVVAGVAVRGGRVLLIRSKRHGVATPGGKVRIGEAHADALRRELREETGLEVVRVGRYLHTDVQPAFQCHLYAVEVSEGEPIAGDDAEAAWWGDPAEILASNIPRDYPLVLDVIRDGIGTHDDAPWFAAALDAARREGAEEVMAMSDPWPLHDVLAKLTEASRALLNRYNYDGHGWELILAACESADAIIARIHARARALPLDAPGGGS